MAKELILMAEPRTVLGKQVKALRRQGLVPGVVYGPAVTSTIQVSISRREFERFYQAHGHSTLFTLSWGDGQQSVFIKEVQLEPIRHAPLHVDFFAPNLKKEITARVPVVLRNLSPNAEGILTHLLDEVEVRALPATLPHQIDADISTMLRSHDSLHAGDLVLPEGVVLVTDPDIVVATLVAPAVQVEEEVVEAPAEETAAEETEADAEGSGTEEA